MSWCNRSSKNLFSNREITVSFKEDNEGMFKGRIERQRRAKRRAQAAEKEMFLTAPIDSGSSFGESFSEDSSEGEEKVLQEFLSAS